MPNLPASTRRWIYTVALAGIPLLVAFGIIEESQAPLWIAFAGAVIAPSLALANISEPAGDETQEAAE